MAERDELINPILMRASAMGARLFRQNTGMAWVGKVIRNGHQTIVAEARPFHAGLCVGSSDLIGWTPVTITPDMVGKQVAVFTALEVKWGTTRNSKEQIAFIGKVKESGGIAAFVRSVDDAISRISGGLL